MEPVCSAAEKSHDFGFRRLVSCPELGFDHTWMPALPLPGRDCWQYRQMPEPYLYTHGAGH